MPGKHFDLDTDVLLGGENSSDITIASQKATKSYIDTKNSAKQDKLTAGQNIKIENNVISVDGISAELSELSDTTITNPTNGQGLLYNETTEKWENKTIDIPSKTSDLTNDSGFITKSVNNLENYTTTTDLNTALSGKADSEHEHTVSDITDFPTNVSAFTNDAGYLTEHQDISGKQDVIDASHKLSSDLVDDTNKTHKFVTTEEKTTWNEKQDSISDLATIRSGAEKGATAVQPTDLAEVATSGDYTDLSNTPVNVSEFTNDAGYLTSQDISSVFVYKGSKATVAELPATGNKQGDVWTVTEDGSEYVWDGTKWEYLGEVLDLSGYQTLITSTNKLGADLVDDSTSTNKFVTASDKTTWSNKQDAISDLADIREGAGKGATAVQPDDLADVATSGAYSDLTGTPTNVSEFTNDAGYLTSHQDISGKQDVISDLSTIRENAQAGKEASDTIATYGDIVSHNADEFLTEHQDISGKQDIIDATHKLSADLLSEGTTNKLVSASEKSTWNGKQDAISDIETIRANATAGKSAKDAVDAMGDIVSHDADEFQVAGDYAAEIHTHAISDVTDLQTTLNGKQATISDLADIRSGAELGSTAVQPSAISDMATKTWVGQQNYLTEHQSLSGLVPTSRTINGKALTANITLNASDVSALPSNTVIPTITDTYSATSSNGMSGKAVASAISGKANSATSLSGYGITDAYTKSEIDGMISAGMHYKGTKASVSALPTTGNVIGDLWNVEDTGANYAWNGTAWDKLSENIDLSGYVPTSRTVNGKALTGNISLTASDVGALPSSTVIPTKTSDLTNDDGFITGITSSDVTTALGFTPYNSTNPNGYTSNIGTITGIKMNGASKGTSGVVDLGTVITSQYTHPTTAGNKHVPSGGSSNQVLVYGGSSGTASWGAVPNHTHAEYSNKDTMRSTEFIVGTQTATTGSWTGVTEDTTLYDGKNINYFLPYAGSGNASLNLTLAGGTTTGAKPIYISGTSYVTTHYGANSCINMTYNATKGAWFVNADRDNNDVTRLQWSNNITAATAITANRVIVGTSSGYKNIAANTTFDITYPILYSKSAINAAATGTNNWQSEPAVNLANNKSGWTGTNLCVVYLVGTLDGTVFTIDSTMLTTTVPTSADNKVYTPLGVMYNTTNCYFRPTNEYYAYVNGKFQKLTYVHPTTSGNKHIPSGGSSGQFLKWSADGTATWAADNDTKNTAGSTDTSSKIFLVGATSQAANPQTYSHDTAFVDANGRVNSAAPANDANDTTVATTKWIKDQSYVTTNTAQTISGTKTFTGNPVFSNDAMGAQLTVNRSNNTSGYSVIKYTNNGTVKGYLGVHYEGRPIWGNSNGTYYNLVRNSTLDTAVGTATKGVYISSSGVATAMTYELNKTVPSDAIFTDTKNTAGSTNSSSKLFLIGATSQAANPQTYSQDTAFVDTDGALNSVTPASGNNSTKVATTAFVTTAIGSYVKKAGDTMTGALNFANNVWNNVGDDAMIGDHNVGGHICIAPKNATYDNSGGLSFHNSSGTALVQLNASSGALTSSGALGLSNNAAKMQYNATTEAIEFVFA